MTLYEKITAELEARKDRSALARGVNAYAFELVEALKDRASDEGRDPKTRGECEEWLLNGAKDWRMYSWGGCSLICDADIAKRLCGGCRPNRDESWLDVQARALYQASRRVVRAYGRMMKA